MKISLGIVQNTKIDFNKFFRFFLITGVVIFISSIVMLFVKPLNLGIDFKGGIVIDIGNVEHESVVSQYFIDKDITEFTIKDFGINDKQITINSEGLESDEINALIEDAQTFIEENNYEFLQSQFVGPSISQDLIYSGIMALLLSFILILIYIWIRFDWQYGIISIITLFFDILVCLLFLSLFQYEFNITTIAALLTIIGYSINDTVVVFDQIRENVRKYYSKSTAEILNISSNSIISRSLSTSITLLLVLVSLYALGGETLKSFSFALIIGTISGTYSSLLLATPLLAYIGDIKARLRKEKEGVSADND